MIVTPETFVTVVAELPVLWWILKTARTRLQTIFYSQRFTKLALLSSSLFRENVSVVKCQVLAYRTYTLRTSSQFDVERGLPVRVRVYKNRTIKYCRPTILLQSYIDI
jgi:hypothetical protein